VGLKGGARRPRKLIKRRARGGRARLTLARLRRVAGCAALGRRVLGKGRGAAASLIRLWMGARFIGQAWALILRGSALRETAGRGDGRRVSGGRCGGLPNIARGRCSVRGANLSAHPARLGRSG
jgi:hypothetical protein